MMLRRRYLAILAVSADPGCCLNVVVKNVRAIESDLVQLFN